MARRSAGFSLVELMVAVVVGLLGILAITSVFVTFEGNRRTTTGSGDAQENALVAMVSLERDLRMAGLGLVGLGCATVNGYNATLTPANVSFVPLPISITRDSPAAGSDMVTVMHSNSAFGNVPTSLTGPMASSDDALNAANADGFVRGDLILISEGNKACSLMQASDDAAKVGTNWTLSHAPGAVDFNPPLGTNIFPAGGYATGAVVTNLGAMARREYFVQGSNLMMRDRNVPDSAVAPLNPVAVVDGVVAIRAQYGRDTNADGYIDVFDNTAPASPGEVVAVRIAVVARSPQLEKTPVSPATLALWDGGTVANGGAIALDATAQQYRYKVYQTTIPLRNVIWNNN